MTLKEQYELVKKAVDNNQLMELFLGAPGYEWGDLKHIPANVATDIGAILEHGLYALFNNGYKDVPGIMKATVYALLNGTPVEIWTAYSVVWAQCWNEAKHKSSFQVINQEFLERVRTALWANKASLVACKELMGWNLKDGLWEDIMISNQTIKRRFGVEIL